METDKNLIAKHRLMNQQIAPSRSARPRHVADVVSALGAVQAQDYLGAVWAIGLRTPNATEATVEQAIAERQIIRTWPMRGTLHFVATADARWMLELLTPRIVAGAAGRFRQLELDSAVFARSRKLFVRALRGNQQLTRDDMMNLLERARISTAGQRGNHILWRLAQEGLLCFAARSGKQHTFALLDEWSPVVSSSRMDREAALAQLARRYFAGHGPATLRDFVWWTGLKMADARAAIATVSSELSKMVVDGVEYWTVPDLDIPLRVARTAHLLPGFDEYLLGYQDRSAVLEPQHAPKLIFGGVFLPTILANGQVAGTWRRELKKKEVAITPNYFAQPSSAAKKALADAVERYGRFLGRPVIWQGSGGKHDH
jgi:hypothetical protein